MESAIAHDMVCGERLASCTCGEPLTHAGPHVCNEPDRCQGSWKGSADKDFEVIVWPLDSADGTADFVRLLIWMNA